MDDWAELATWPAAIDTDPVCADSPELNPSPASAPAPEKALPIFARSSPRFALFPTPCAAADADTELALSVPASPLAAPPASDWNAPGRSADCSPALALFPIFIAARLTVSPFMSSVDAKDSVVAFATLAADAWASALVLSIPEAYFLPAAFPDSAASSSPSVNIPLTVSHRLDPMLLRPSTIASRICLPTASQSTLIIPSLNAWKICGAISISIGMASPSPWIIATINCTPDSISVGSICTSPMINDSISRMPAGISIGMACTSP